MMITVFNPFSGGEWKVEEETYCNNGENGKQFIQCIEQKAYSIKDIVTSSNYSFKAKPVYFGFGLIQSLEFDIGMISHDSSFKIPLSQNQSYLIRFTDRKLMLQFGNPYSVPRTTLQVDKTARHHYIYLKLISHSKILKIILMTMHTNIIITTSLQQHYMLHNRFRKLEE